MKRYLLLIFATFVCWMVAAQTPEDQTIFRAMENELVRNMNELKMGDVGKPFWIGYLYCDIRVMYVSASLGEVVLSQLQPQRINGTRVLLGDYEMTSDLNYNSAYSIRGSGIETDEQQIRRELWLNTDYNYKQTAPNMARKAALRQQSARTPEEEKLPDLLPITSIDRIAQSPAFGLDRMEWEKRMAELSAIFTGYPSLYGSAVSFSAYDWTNYAYTSEQVRMRHPVSFASVNVTASVRTPDGEEFSDNMSIYAPSDLTLPDEKELHDHIDRFARNLSEYARASKIEEFYSGPVLFVGQPVFRMFDENLLSNDGNGVLVKRRNENSGNMGGIGQQSARRLENRIDQRVIDRKFTVTNHSTLRQHKQTPLLGYYEMDADGVIPPDSFVVVDGGILQATLNGRIPTLKSSKSTGSNRFSLNMNPVIAPGTVEIASSDGKSIAQLEEELVKLAKSDGLKYAYIIERMNGNLNLLWRMDVTTRERTLVRNGEVSPVSLTQLKRVAGVSEESEVYNYLAGQVPSSMIYPSGVLLEDVEIGEMETTKEKPSPIANPLERGKK